MLALINTLVQHLNRPLLNTQSIRNQHLDQFLVNTWSTSQSTVGRELVNLICTRCSIKWWATQMYQLTFNVNWYIWVAHHSTKYQPAITWSRVNWDVDWVLIEMSIECWSGVKINTLLWAPLVHVWSEGNCAKSYVELSRNVKQILVFIDCYLENLHVVYSGTELGITVADLGEGPKGPAPLPHPLILGKKRRNDWLGKKPAGQENQDRAMVITITHTSFIHYYVINVIILYICSLLSLFNFRPTSS